jgi:hypothetical protein
VAPTPSPAHKPAQGTRYRRLRPGLGGRPRPAKTVQLRSTAASSVEFGGGGDALTAIARVARRISPPWVRCWTLAVASFCSSESCVRSR